MQPSSQKQSQTPLAPRILAAVDLGSNSFHMVVARYEDGNLTLLDRLREMVRLADGLDAQHNLDIGVQQRALDCLSRFGERLNSFDPNDVAIVGTNTLRKARNSAAFLSQAEKLLGHPIEIISGLEEARLVYLGVAHSVPPSSRNRLVADIGGGSTELVVGREFEAKRLYSLFMGCVSVSRKYFPDGKISHAGLKRARLAIDLEISPVVEPLKAEGWRRAYGSSGTIRTIGRLAALRDPAQRGISRQVLNGLIEEAMQYSHIEQIDWPELQEKRRPVFMGGLIVLERLFEAFELSKMHVADYALREGLLYDTIGHWSGEDARERSVNLLARRYDVDQVQADRLVEASANLFKKMRKTWSLPKGQGKRLLNWSARLHEIGLTIAHSHYHRHGAYVVENSDLPGFSKAAQQRIAWLIEGHRRRIPAMLPLPEGSEWHRHLPRLLAIFRVASVLVRGRKARELPTFSVQVDEQLFELSLPSGWLSEHPLTRAGLQQEVAKLKELNIDFQFT